MITYWVYVFESFDEEPGWREEYIADKRMDAGAITAMAKGKSERNFDSRIRVTEHQFSGRVLTYVPLEE